MPSKTARLFNNGGSQAVRLPADFRFEGDEIFIRRDQLSGDVILSKKDVGWNSWDEFFRLRGDAVPEEFMADRLLNSPLDRKAPFSDEE